MNAKRSLLSQITKVNTIVNSVNETKTPKHINCMRIIQFLDTTLSIFKCTLREREKKLFTIGFFSIFEPHSLWSQYQEDIKGRVYKKMKRKFWEI